VYYQKGLQFDPLHYIFMMIGGGLMIFAAMFVLEAFARKDERVIFFVGVAGLYLAHLIYTGAINFAAFR
jgi:hypothetical protein